MNVGGVTGPECEDCGATALDLDSWNHRIHPPGEASEGDMKSVARTICWEIEKPCVGECAATGRCQGGPAPIFMDCARAAIAALPAPPEREALKRGLEQCNDYLNDPRWNSMIRMAAAAIRSALLGEEK